MKDAKNRLLYISGILVLMALTSLEYAVFTWQFEGPAMLHEPRGIVFAGGTIVFALSAAVAFGFFLHTWVKRKK